MTTPTESLEPVPLSSKAIGKSAELSVLQLSMARAGWTIDFVDIDLTRSTPMALIRCHRNDGLWFSARVDSLGRCSFETFQRRSWVGKPENTKGRWPQSLQSEDDFLGRSRPTDSQALLNHMAMYIVDNAISPIGLPEVLSDWRALIESPRAFLG
jgi:hypothetical protein